MNPPHKYRAKNKNKTPKFLECTLTSLIMQTYSTSNYVHLKLEQAYVNLFLTSGATCNLLVKKLVSLLQNVFSILIRSSVVGGGQLLFYNNMCT